MDIFIKLRGLMGLPPRHNDEDFSHRRFEGLDTRQDDDNDEEDEELRFPDLFGGRSNWHDDSRRPNNPEPFGFRVFTDPLEMNRFFEQQIEEIFKNFGMFGNIDMFEENNQPKGFRGFPITPAPEWGSEDQSPRDQLLKIPDSKGPAYSESNHEDIILDDEVSKFGIAGLIEGDKQFNPQKRITSPPRSFSSSTSIQIIRKPDGTVERRQTVRDSSGCETTTVTKQQGSIINSTTTKVLPSGEKEEQKSTVNVETDSLWQSPGTDNARPSDSVLSPPLADPAFKSIFSKFFPKM